MKTYRAGCLGHPAAAPRQAPGPCQSPAAGRSRVTNLGGYDMGVGPTIRSLRKRLRLTIAVAAAAALAVGVAIGASAASASSTPKFAGYHTPSPVSASFYRDTNRTATPIKHLVVIYDENVSFDHYFGTYPRAANTGGPRFTAKPRPPKGTNLEAKAPGGRTLLTHNPNGANPKRLSPTNPKGVLTCDQDHDYTPEQDAFDH